MGAEPRAAVSGGMMDCGAAPAGAGLPEAWQPHYGIPHPRPGTDLNFSFPSTVYLAFSGSLIHRHLGGKKKKKGGNELSAMLIFLSNS